MSYRATLRSIEPAANRWREYRVEVIPALFGWTLATWRGRIGSTLRRRDLEFTTQEELLEKLAALLRRRIQHGYLFPS